MNKVKNQFDPTMMVVVVDVTKGVFPDTLHYNLRDKDRTLMTVEPSFDEFGDPCYQIPRFYAERLLQNLGGRTYRLVSPTKLIIKMPNGRGGSNIVTVVAHKKCGDGQWHELSEEEILEIEAGINSDDESPLHEDEPKTPKEPKQPKTPKEPGMSKKATRKATKAVEEAPLNEIGSDPENIENDGSIPSLDDVLGE
jgi:hypothetical protein